VHLLVTHLHTPLSGQTTNHQAATTITTTMCQWERIIYACSPNHDELQRMAYSCEKYRRHVYGPCPFREGDLVVDVQSDEYCPECRELYRYVNYR
jgi:hypothetical protein